jgi:predicted Zn-dependent protease
VLQSSWNESVETGSVESITVNGLPAAVAKAKGKDWAFRLAAIRVGSTTYRLVLASRGQPEALERAFRASLESIRPVTAEEARGVRPLRLELATAGPDDTVESLSARMLVPNRAAERFLVLNGLDRGARVKAGERYKIVAE